ncbi:MAG: (2Fe-2S)-binding protein [Deltaproteobacteria bacterium]|nr:(2Fe-2S)-binding protein [Deltaproteobacteria bacterium]
MRVLDHPILGPLTPGRRVAFSFEGRRLYGIEGEPIAAALAASGIRLLRRTADRGQPRGVFCAMGLCTDCMVVVNGRPKVRACVTPLEEGMDIRMEVPEVVAHD